MSVIQTLLSPIFYIIRKLRRAIQTLQDTLESLFYIEIKSDPWDFSKATEQYGDRVLERGELFREVGRFFDDDSEFEDAVETQETVQPVIPKELMAFLGPMMDKGFIFEFVEPLVYERVEVEVVECEDVHEQEEDDVEEDTEPVEGAVEEQSSSTAIADASTPATSVECGVCYFEFSKSEVSRPNLLFCGHSFCITCIRQLWKLSDKFWLNCPTCKIGSRIGKKIERSVRRNWAMLEAIRQQKTAEKIAEESGEEVEIHHPKCQSCHLDYSNHIANRTPRIFQTCGHSECEECLLEKMKIQRYAVECTRCEAYCAVGEEWKSSLPKNYALVDMLRK